MTAQDRTRKVRCVGTGTQYRIRNGADASEIWNNGFQNSNLGRAGRADIGAIALFSPPGSEVPRSKGPVRVKTGHRLPLIKFSHRPEIRPLRLSAQRSDPAPRPAHDTASASCSVVRVLSNRDSKTQDRRHSPQARLVQRTATFRTNCLRFKERFDVGYHFGNVTRARNCPPATWAIITVAPSLAKSSSRERSGGPP